MEKLLNIFLVVFTVSSAIFVALSVIGFIYEKGHNIYNYFKKNKIKKNDEALRQYLKEPTDEKLSIVDETPREAYIGNSYYLLKPLKYRQYTRLCVLFADTLSKLQEMDVAPEEIGANLGSLITKTQDDFFKAIAYVLYFSKNPKEKDDNVITKGAELEFEYIRDNATLEEITRIMEIIIIQNDIERAMKSFGLFAGKKNNMGK